MIINTIDEQNNLFRIESFYPVDLIQELANIDLHSIPAMKQEWQLEYNRVRLGEHPTLKKLDQFTKDNLQLLNKLTGMDASYCDTGFWFDGPGFTMSNHLDNSDVYAAMQLYVLDLPECPGTKFTDSKGTERITFPYKVNTGYLMINGIDQYHEVAGVVPANTWRLCSYTWFQSEI